MTAPPVLAPWAGTVWRFVEDQNTSSTMKLVSNTAEQRRLEELLDTTKPPVPVACRHLDYLLFTPFRYAARAATRYRRQGARAGVFYGSDRVETCAAEVAFWRLLFLLESPGLAPPRNPFEMTAFSTEVATDRAVDVAGRADRAALSDPSDYAPCHALADAVRAAGGEVIRYPSVRAPGGTNAAVLTCAAFARATAGPLQGWWFRFEGLGIFAVQRFGPGRLDFPVEMFAADPRVAAALAQRRGTE